MGFFQTQKHEKVRIAVALSLEKILTAFPLGVVGVPNLEPTRLIRQVWVELPFRNDALKIILASKSEQTLAIVLDMITVRDAVAVCGQNRAQFMLALG